ncbi:hypothetical protein D1007_12333 [Hordeum vulgare]|nr:hypothetical protein D1007_12333 [Hordeum vulgare]
MAPSRKIGKAATPPASVATTWPALMPSRVSKAKDLDLVLLFVARNTHEGGGTAIWPGSTVRGSLVRPAYPFLLHSVYARLVLPFSDFFYAILSHYQIRDLHIQPNSILLAIFAFYF